MTTDHKPQTVTLAEFLLARIAADQDWAERWVHPSHSTTLCGDCALAQERILAECEARRRIVEAWDRRWDEAEDAEEQRIHSMFASQATGLGTAVRALAAVYADHPDYDESWRP